ncbi:MAG TPA: hydroxymyristoyl-ACP dehydratase [Puia sp.]|nr:hydroxymyristoyl-ACP dehydratase [Puia sp.]
MNYQYILDRLPYKSSFRFVDGITFLDSDKVVGHYTLKPDAFFYADHFPGNPVTPGAIVTEIMAQIGLVVLGIYLVTSDQAERTDPVFPLLTSSEASFLKMVQPGQKVTVISDKIYFRFDKLKCRIVMQDEAGDIIAKGVFSGMIKQLTK